jgi:hypothetical protein
LPVLIPEGVQKSIAVANVALWIYDKIGDGRKNGVVIVSSRGFDRGYGGNKKSYA